MNLCSIGNVKSLLEKYSLSPKKGFGQNFLINPGIPEMIAEGSSSFVSGKTKNAVLEIGPGIGALTCKLAEVYEKVVAVEIDRGLDNVLKETLADYDNIEVVFCDFMKLDLDAFLKEHFSDYMKEGGTISVCANLPYYITSPVIMKLTESFPFSSVSPFSSITVMIQLEVADRLKADEKKKEYGAVSVSLSLRNNVEKLFDVSPHNFYPAPKVSSSVISILPHGGIRELYPDFCGDDDELEKLGQRTKEIISLSFEKRRKTFVNALSDKYDKVKTESVLSSLGFRTDIRGEKLSVRDYIRLADYLGRK